MVKIHGSVVYSAEINCDELIKEGKLALNSDAPITVSNIVDKVGNKAENAVIDKTHKSTNGYSLNYGLVEKEVFYIASDLQNIGHQIGKGDINADGLINSYDKILLSLAACGNIQLTEEEVERADLNKDGKITSKDVIAIQKIIEKHINYIYKDIDRNFTVYNEKNEVVKNDKLYWSIVDGEGTEFVNGEDASKLDINYDKTTGKLNLKVKDNVKNPITIKAYIEGENNDERKIGTLELVTVNENDSKDAWIKMVGTSKTGTLIKGDINNDGYITGYDSIFVLRASVGLEKLTEEEKKQADINGDGKVDALDALLILRIESGLEEFKDPNKSYDNSVCNIIKKGDSVSFDLTFEQGGKLVAYKDLENKEIINEIKWDLTSNVENAFSIETNNGTVTLTANADTKIPDGAIAVVRGEVVYNDGDEADNPYAFIYWKLTDSTKIETPEDSIEIKLDDKEVEADLAASVNVDNQKIEYKSNNNDVAEVIVDEYGNAKILAKESGSAIVVIESDNEKKEINVNVTKAIESIDVDKTDVTVKQGSQEEFKVTINPSNATEDLKVESKDTGIARVSYDAQTNSYKISGVQEGNTAVEVYSASNSELKKIIHVKVDKMELPTITKVTVENNEGNKVYKAGDEIYLRINFDGSVIGTVPELKIKFGNYYSVNNTKFVEGLENNTILRYKYTVAEGDNGKLMIEKLSGGVLTDTTKDITAVTSKVSDVFEQIKAANPDKDYINDGIYETIEEIEADTTGPIVKVVTSVDKDTNWLKDGDEIKVQILSEESLKAAPTVYFNGLKAKVEGSDSVFTASLPVTKDLKDGYLEIKVTDIVDSVGNAREAVIAKQDNINEPIIIDNSAPIISSVKIKKEQGKELKPGETVDIQVKFADNANVTKEYITSEDIPLLNLKVGGKDAKGTITSDYEVGKYVQSIKYTYTFAEGDSGEITVDGMSGIITDVAGNETDLSKIKIANQNTKQTEEPKQENTNYVIATKTPKTGDNVIIYVGIILVITGIGMFIVEYIHRKNKKNKQGK